MAGPYELIEVESLTGYVAGLATYLLIWPEDGVLRKEDVRGVFDGSIFYKKAEQHRQKVLGIEKHKRLM